MAITGKTILVTIAGTDGAVAVGKLAKTHDLTTTADTIEAASPTQGEWKEYSAGRKEWGISLSHLLSAAADISQVLAAGSTYTVTIHDKANAATLTGKAICTQAKQNYAVGNLANGSFTFKGTGPLE